MTQPSGVLWITEQVKTKLAAGIWSIFLFFGGLIFVLYFAHIRFMPELELGSSVALLAAAAITGAVYLLALSTALTLPSVIWTAAILKLKAFKIVFYEHNKLMKFRVGLWLVLPVFVELLVTVIAAITVDSWSKYDSQTRSLNFYGRYSDLIVGIAATSVFVFAWAVMTIVLFHSKKPALTRLQSRIKDNQIKKPRLWRLKVKLVLKAAAKSLLYWSIYAVSCFCFILPMLLVGRVASRRYKGDQELLFFLLALVAFIVVVNILITLVSNWANALKWRAFISISASFLLLLFFEITVNISSSVMNMYGLGNINNSFVVLKPEGCALVAQAGVNRCPKKDENCVLNNVHILSRVGATYYLRTTNATGAAVNLTMPRDVVLSWGRRTDYNVIGLANMSFDDPVIYSVVLESLRKCDAGNIAIVRDRLLKPGEELTGGEERIQDLIQRGLYSASSLTISEQFDAYDFATKRAVPFLFAVSAPRLRQEDLLETEFKYRLISKDDFGDVPIDEFRWAQFRTANPNTSVVLLSSINTENNNAAFFLKVIDPQGSWKLYFALLHQVGELWVVLDKVEISSGSFLPH